MIMILIRRLLPIIATLSIGAAFWFQSRATALYPWVALCGVAVVPVAAFVISWKRTPISDFFEKMGPTFVLLLSLAFGLLLVEGALALGVLIAIAALATLISLELLFLFAYDPAAYPVNGISRVNLAYVPLAIWYAVRTSAGLLVFLHAPRSWHLVVTTILGAVLFRTTNHPGATRRQNAAWTLIGVLAGLEIGWIGTLLPVGMGIQGAIAALLLTGALRVRRYLYEPKPSRRMAWSEGVGGLLLFALTIGTAKWL